MKPFKLAQPTSVSGAVAVAAGDFETVKMKAGGTDLLALMKERVANPDLVVNLGGIVGLDRIAKTDRGLEIGALVNIVTVAEHDGLAKEWPALAHTAEKTATPQIRNVGTVGGNLCQRPRCWYFRDETYHCVRKGGTYCFAQEGENDYHAIFGNANSAIVHPSNLAPALIAYGAQLEIVGPKGPRTVACEDFFVTPEQDITRENVLKPNEVLTKVILPGNSGRKNSCYFEAREKQSFDYPLCGAVVSLTMTAGKVSDARVVLGAVAPIPMRRPDLEKMLAGKRVNETLIKNVADASVKGANPLGKNDYKLILLKAVLSRALRRAATA